MTRILIPALMAAASILATAPAQADLFGTVKGLLDEVGGDKQEGGEGSSLAGALSNGDLIEGLKEALRVGTDRVSAQLGTTDGYNKDPDIHIPLPKELKFVQDSLRRIGMSQLADDVELKLNRGAEQAAPKAKQLILSAIENMTFEDAKRIYDGPKDAATQYFRKVTSSDLRTTIKPVIEDSLKDVGAINAYDTMMADYKSIPLVPDVKADLTDHATNLALDGIFLYLAREEAAIRENPAKRTTEILMKVFGQ